VYRWLARVAARCTVLGLDDACKLAGRMHSMGDPVRLRHSGVISEGMEVGYSAATVARLGDLGSERGYARIFFVARPLRGAALAVEVRGVPVVSAGHFLGVADFDR